MKVRHIALTAGVILGSMMPAAWAVGPATDEQGHSTVIDIAGHDVPVVKEGLYDRFRSNPPLSVIEEESPDTDLSWFKTLEKTKVNIGFESYSPNFYYENSKVTAIYTADLDRLRELMPDEVLEQVEPLQVWPGRGLVALTAYAYHYCDNDSYNEISLAIVTNKPGDSNLGPISLISQSMSKDFWGYVLKLPVDTELARVRGVVGYNLPKWLTGIQYRENAESLTFEVMDQETGELDFVLETAKLDDVSEEPSLVTNSFTNIDQEGELTYGYAVSRQLSYASSMSDDTVNLTLGDGGFSRYIKSLDLGEMVRYDYVPDFQSALYAPESLASLIKE
ncbi:acetoacetate decarboxylase (ADC) [Marinobacter sp. NP-4(2019)]|uniref:acetoacetate decarboxylase (ADC) n=1 Tax=Marinobacter sp. NP-4(2019) TaxID=2488665 RepID=UPI000FC3CB44|nr:acetoacetate decarboxylase (ADC) [Marinobacter sp. NP-4(2019)]AZT83883.1 acetoacetate decarboxylase (ADC) [Marinobacter sp. NP-4(2019)]